MTTFRFIHTADWQIGAPFGAYPDDLSARLREARTSAISRIAQLAQDKSVKHVIVAGDVWDSEQPSDQAIRQPLDLMGEAEGVNWWLLPGNHDPFRKNMLWDRIAERAPDNVHLLLKPEPAEAESGVWFLPAPWTSKDPGRDLTEWMDEATTPEGELRIGIAHGSIHDFSPPDGDSEAGTKSIIPPNRPELACLDYLALGDWHGTLEIGPRIWYSGTPEPDKFHRNNPGHVLLVEIQSGQEPVVEIRETAQFRWQIHNVECLPAVPSYPEIDELETQGALRQTMQHLSLRGQLTYDEWTKLQQRVNELNERCAFMELDDEKLTKLVSEDDLDQLDQGGSVRVAADRLHTIRQDESLSESDRDLAGEALILLLSFAAEEMIS